jgi:REP element-mobilizing transposase RayT
MSINIHYPLGRPLEMKPPARGAIIDALKSTVTRKIRRIKGYENYKIWHRNYYEHVIRDEKDFQRILDYIQANPLNWENDSEYPRT